MAKYFNINENERYHSYSELVENVAWGRKLNMTEKFHVLCEQLRPLGLQPYIYFDNSGFEIQAACKKFMQKRGQWAALCSKKALEYMAFCDELEGAE